MSDQDRESKTEEASARKIEDALDKGNTPFSREVGHAIFFTCAGLCLPVTAEGIVTGLVPALAPFLERPWEIRLATPQDVITLFSLVSSSAALVVAPAVLAICIVSLLSSGLQNRPRLASNRIKPQFSRISPAQGLKRVFGSAGQVEFVKAVLKTVLVASVIALSLRQAAERFVGLAILSHVDFLCALAAETAGLLFKIGLLMLALAAGDLVWTRVKWRKDLRMSRQEAKDEQKQSEGDPMVRARQRSIARNRARKRMITAVPRATLVIANPTHYAVAMRYVPGETVAPLVVAKGIDHLAIRIRELAKRNNIPVVEDKMLARSLHAAVQADRPIPVEFYRAIAEIILFLNSQQRIRLRGL